MLAAVVVLGGIIGGTFVSGMQTIFIELKSRRGFASTKQRLKLLVPTENLALDNLGKGIILRTLLVDTLARFGHFPFEMLQPTGSRKR